MATPDAKSADIGATQEPERKPFSVGAILSVYTGCSAVADFGEIHALVDYLTNGTWYTHQLPTIMRTGAMQRDILAQFPAIANHPAPEFDAMPADGIASEVAGWVLRTTADIGANPLVARGVESMDIRLPFSAGLERLGADL